MRVDQVKLGKKKNISRFYLLHNKKIIWTSVSVEPGLKFRSSVLLEGLNFKRVSGSGFEENVSFGMNRRLFFREFGRGGSGVFSAKVCLKFGGFGWFVEVQSLIFVEKCNFVKFEFQNFCVRPQH